jgi:hypothetical protein
MIRAGSLAQTGIAQWKDRNLQMELALGRCLHLIQAGPGECE